MGDENIDLFDCPKVTPEMFGRAVRWCVLKPDGARKQFTLGLDADVVARFKVQEPGYQTCINELLREYKRARGK